MRRFAAKLLFQYRVVINGISNTMRDVEERIVVVDASSVQVALRKAKRRAKSSETTYQNDDGNAVLIEFIGIMDFLELGVECDDGDVWYEIRTLREPMERKAKFIPPESKFIKFIGSE